MKWKIDNSFDLVAHNLFEFENYFRVKMGLRPVIIFEESKARDEESQRRTKSQSFQPNFISNSSTGIKHVQRPFVPPPQKPLMNSKAAMLGIKTSSHCELVPLGVNDPSIMADPRNQQPTVNLSTNPDEIPDGLNYEESDEEDSLNKRPRPVYPMRPKMIRKRPTPSEGEEPPPKRKMPKRDGRVYLQSAMPDPLKIRQQMSY